MPSPRHSRSPLSGEQHLKNIKQLTFGGENAEAYFSSDGKQLIFQSKRDGRGCDQIYTDEHRRLERKDGLERRGPHDVLVFFQGRQEGALCLDARRRQRMPAESRYFEGLCLGGLSRLRPLHRKADGTDING